ncbi:hypothetical protein BXU06_01790 [Aquaspirillum sp. LM1]|nr:hypothetical protein BXU06_01790 [Aquaspirillum sp. LM1]
MVGVLIGLMVGVGAAAGVAFYLNRAATPFAPREAKPAKEEPAESMVALPPPDTPPAKPAAPPGPASLEPGAPIQRAPDLSASLPVNPLLDTPPPPAAAAPVAAPAENKPEDKPARKAEKAEPAAPQTPAEKHAKAEPPKYDFYKILPGNNPPIPQDKPTPEKEPASAEKTKRIYLQVGAYQKEVDADNMKAKLALLGVEANIQSVNTPEKGLLHRVRVGPLTRAEDVERLRAQLKMNGLNPTPVKAD